MSYFSNLFSLEGKKALVTGGSTGIGFMICSALVHAGAHVMIASRKVEECEKVAQELNALDAPGSAEGLRGDVSNEEGILELAQEIRARTDKLDILVNNAGLTWGAPLEEFPYQAWQRVMDVNVTGMFMLTKELLPLLEASASHEDPARIINLGSVMGTLAYGTAYSYVASKAAVHHITRMLSAELAPKKITVNAFAPGPFQSRMMRFATDTDEKVDAISKTVPLGRIGAPEDVAGATLYLCGKGGSYITGAILPLDGGKSADSPSGVFGED